MSITPQAIKDQEFQAKFRGYDTIEVKAYLELLAEEFFELLEENRVREENDQALTEEKEALVEQNERFINEKESLKAEVAELRVQLSDQGKKTAELQVEMDELQTVIADHEQEKRELEDEMSAQEVKVRTVQDECEEQRREKETYKSRLGILEQQNQELKKEEVDFKSTLGAAQKFANQVKSNSQKDAKYLMDKAEADVARFRTAAQDELSRLPQEIENLHRERTQVREDLKEILQTYLNALDSFSGVEENEKNEDLNDLFQKITMNDDGTIAPDDLEKINMDLDLPASLTGSDEGQS